MGGADRPRSPAWLIDTLTSQRRDSDHVTMAPPNIRKHLGIRNIAFVNDNQFRNLCRTHLVKNGPYRGNLFSGRVRGSVDDMEEQVRLGRSSMVLRNDSMS